MRASYWYENLESVLDCKLSVITNEKNAENDNIYYVNNNKTSFLSKLIHDKGVAWKKSIFYFLQGNNKIYPDLVIITGGPFMHFGLSDFFRRKYNSKIILDYRDPFSNNPIFQNSRIKKMIKSFFERKFNSKADAIITVNKYCAKLIPHFYSKKNAIIQNGYDESVELSCINNIDKLPLKIIYAGKLYFSLDNIAHAIRNEECVLTYMGADYKNVNSTNSIKNKGLLSYEDTLEQMQEHHVGLIQSTAYKHQSTTKVFDYIRSKLIILVVLNKKSDSESSLKDELKSFPNVFWCNNNANSISEQIQKIKQHKYIEIDNKLVEKYSRRNQMIILKELIEKLIDEN